MRKLYIFYVGALLVLLTSCSGTGYLDAIPAESKTLLSFNLGGMADDAKVSDDKKAEMLKELLHVDDPSDCGIDLSQKLYMFISPDSQLGMDAKVGDDGDMKDWLNKLSKTGFCSKVTEKRGFNFTVIKGSWVVGFSDEAMLVMGPAVGAAQGEIQRQIIKYLKQDEDEGIKGTPMFDRLDSIDSNVAMVSKAEALPAKFTAPFVMGAPKDSDPSEILIAAAIKKNGNCLNITGESFSFKPSIDKALKEAAKSYKPITGKYLQSIPSDALSVMLMNVDGNNLLNLLRSDKGMQAMLAGLNTALDVDNMIKSIKGDVAIVMPQYNGDAPDFSLAAQLGNRNWMKDIGYWKQSCPKGSKIVDWGKDAYHYISADENFYFGVSADNQLYSGNIEQLAKGSISKSSKPLSQEIQKQLTGKRLCILINLGAMKDDNGETKTIMNLLKPVFGDINAITYSIK